MLDNLEIDRDLQQRNILREYNTNYNHDQDKINKNSNKIDSEQTKITFNLNKDSIKSTEDTNPEINCNNRDYDLIKYNLDNLNSKELNKNELSYDEIDYRDFNTNEYNKLELLKINFDKLLINHQFNYINIDNQIVDKDLIPGYIYKFTDQAYLRFLRGCKLDINQASRRMIDHIQFRINWQIWTLKYPESFPYIVNNNSLSNVQGFDYYSRPIMYESARYHNSKKRDLNEAIKYTIFKIEDCLSKSKDERIVSVYDLRYLSYQSMDMEMMKALVEIFNKQYPEIGHKMIIIDAPYLFTSTYSMILQYLLDPITRKKVNFVKFNEVEKLFDKNIIPDI
eukprot:Mrub_04766.p1 GENE.Mrub_04766~~Mrub_04766.p1  ORF type:complete len:367 (-),score=55.05 Mrub_04766:120-1133(-)